ncbi:GNAT family N-acetyltransferase [Halobacterium sp. KA-4]|uniref:GNAT family N-acetyltransferase n=1 Tax=Halobacterium sp. KA-4 TaxID=2896367 RepID=UPI001E54A095|nr:GNAT family N-acetyltransferase [Halobacterium sp. KA-4]MCD2199956.1 GNAT family N-acetyltransferase [Halobacterium sp. KA-4]
MVRPYTDADSDALWELKRGFETGLGEGTGDEAKQATYEAKLDEAYRSDWLDWVDRCVTENERCVQVAEREDGLAGYVFVLPESMAFVWDAAVLNEVYVAPDFRGTSVADDLMEAALSVAREQSLPLDRMVLDVDRQNERAKAFYERYGFEHWGEMVARDL